MAFALHHETLQSHNTSLVLPMLLFIMTFLN
jgi:hypothetical protein